MKSHTAKTWCSMKVTIASWVSRVNNWWETTRVRASYTIFSSRA